MLAFNGTVPIAFQLLLVTVKEGLVLGFKHLSETTAQQDNNCHAGVKVDDARACRRLARL